MNNPSQVSPGEIYRQQKPVRDPLYLKFIRQLPCIGCLKRYVDAAHTGPHGIGQKSCDLCAVPLCRRCHQEYDRNPIRFAEKHQLDIPALVTLFNSFYRTKIKQDAA
jgi:hypothetical protein